MSMQLDVLQANSEYIEIKVTGETDATVIQIGVVGTYTFVDMKSNRPCNQQRVTITDTI